MMMKHEVTCILYNMCMLQSLYFHGLSKQNLIIRHLFSQFILLSLIAETYMTLALKCL